VAVAALQVRSGKEVEYEFWDARRISVGEVPPE
jgi:hypothetical protein